MLNIRKIIFFTLTAAMLCTGVCPAHLAEYAETGSEDYHWANVPLGAGGFVTGLAVHPKEPNLVYARTDVGGVYRWDEDNEVWIPLNDKFTIEDSDLYGIDGIALDENNPDMVYIAAGGKSGPNSDVLKSADRGKTWQRLYFKGASFDPNGNYRGMGECIAVDPNNSSVLYVGTYKNGLWKSTNGGVDWEQVYVTSNPVRSVVIDKNRADRNGSLRIYAAIAEAGLIITENGGKDWRNLEGSAKTVKRMALKSDGSQLYAASTEGLFKYSDGAWTDISPSGAGGMTFNAVTINPENENELMCIGPHTKANEMAIPMWYSNDAGNSWVNKSETSYLSSTLSWDLKNNQRGGFASNAHDIVFDTHRSGRVWMSDWFGVYKTDDIRNSGAQYWTYLYSGMEETVPRKLITPENGQYRLIAGIADMDGAVWEDYREYPKRRIRDGNRTDPPKWTWMMGTQGIDYCIEDPNIVVRVGYDWNEEAKAEISLDGTKTWSNIVFTKKSAPTQTYSFYQFGHVAVSAAKNPQTGYPSIVMIPAGHAPVVSDDLGKTWSDVSGITDTAICTHAWNKGGHISSDKVDGATFYIHDRNNASYNQSKTYVSHDWGHTWTNPSTLGKQNVSWYIDKSIIKAAPYMKGVVWRVTGDRLLYRSVNGGNSFYPAPGITEVECFGFGKNAPDRENPTAYLYGSVNGVKGVYRSVDMGDSWCRIDLKSAPPGCSPEDIQGDMRTFGVVYLATGGRGIFYGEPQSIAPPPAYDYSIDELKCRKYSTSARAWVSCQTAITREKETAAALIAAVYDASGALCGVSVKNSDEIFAAGSNSAIYSQNVIVQPQQVKTVKAFVWESLESQRVLSKECIFTFE